MKKGNRIGMGAAVAFVGMVLLSSCTQQAQETSVSEEIHETTHAVPVVKDENNDITPLEELKEEKKTNISECNITVKNKTYAEHFTEPGIRVTCGEKTLQRDKDYIVTYKNTEDTGAGRYSLTVSMTGDYEGSVEKEYEIRPVGTSLKGFDNKVNAITLHWVPRLSSADGYEIAYTAQEDLSDWQSITAEGTETDSYTFSELPENTVYYVRLRSYKKLGEEKLYSMWSSPEVVRTKPVEVRDGVTYIDGILIANKTYGLPSDYGDGLDSEAVDAFYTMRADAAQDGCYLDIVSGFRSYWVQDTVYRNFCYERGTEAADRVSARPGHSEHQTGLAMDINSTWFTFADTAEGKWLAANCWKYGFLIRYPEGKEDITGYTYESWHIRYLGQELAAVLYESGETLEEYLGITSRYAE